MSNVVNGNGTEQKTIIGILNRIFSQPKDMLVTTRLVPSIGQSDVPWFQQLPLVALRILP